MDEVSAVAPVVLSKKYKHLMIDLETLGKTSDAVILSIGAVAFDMDGTIGPDFEMFPKVDEQFANRKIEWSNIQWWMGQEQMARSAIADAYRSLSLEGCLVGLFDFCKDNLDEHFKVWSNGASFDIAMMNHAYAQCGMETPWTYRNQLDCRTMVYLSKISTKKFESSGIKHNALDDCKWQISWTTEAFKILRGY